ncbi:putative RNA-directed DNA polymerase, partial [Aphis craccivora]
MFIYDLLNNYIDCPDLLIIRLETHVYFMFLFIKKKICSDSFFPRALLLCNSICNEVDFYFMTRESFKTKALCLLSN